MEPTPTNDGPVLNLINKRLRALRKKLNRITQMEESISQGKKTLNKEQEDTFRSKPSVLASIDELEKLRQPISVAVSQEIELSLKNTIDENPKEGEDGGVDVVGEVLKLVYFGSLFDVKSLMSGRENLLLTRLHERSCCLTYDYVTDDEDCVMLRELDLDLIAGVGGKLVSRAVDSGLSHEKALEECVEKAKKWLGRSEEAVETGSSITYAGLREKLNKIMASEYFTTTPEIKAPTEVAAAGGDYTSFSVPAYGSADSSTNLDVSVESSVTDTQEEEPVDAHGKEIYDEQPGTVEEPQQGGSDAGNVPEQTNQTELGVKDTEKSRDVDPKEEQAYPDRRPYQNNRGGRGGSRRGYPNGRGVRGGSRGGGYHNGRNGQFYDQPGSGGYYPRNQNYRGRGGKGMGGNTNYRDNDGHVNYAQEGS